MTLEILILDAHARGSTRELERLQAEFRRRGEVIRGDSRSPQLVEGKTSPSRRRSARTAVQLRETLPETPFQVHLPASVLGQIEREVHDAYHYFGQRLETGGLLLGLYRAQAWPPRSFIVQATGPGPGSRHGHASVVVDREAIIAETRADMFELGFWHTHPGSTPTPSPEDLACSRLAIDRTRSLNYVDLIVTPRNEGLGWTCPEIHAWVSRRTYDRGYVCQPALIVET